MQWTACWNKNKNLTLSHAAPLCELPGGHLAPYKPGDPWPYTGPANSILLHTPSHFEVLVYCKYFFHKLGTLITKKICGGAVFYIGDPNKIVMLNL